jgi:hypothetical protein
MATDFYHKVEILDDLNTYGTDTEKYGNFVESNRLQFNTVWLAASIDADDEAELPDNVSETVNRLWIDLLHFLGVADEGFEDIQDLDPSLDTSEED